MPGQDQNIERLKKGLDFSSTAAISKPNPSIFEKIQEQRHDQRRKLFNNALGITIGSVIFLFGLIFVQSIVRIHFNEHFQILEGYQLEIITVGVLLQSFGIIYIIAKSIWDDSNYKELLSKDVDRH